MPANGFKFEVVKNTNTDMSRVEEVSCRPIADVNADISRKRPVVTRRLLYKPYVLDQRSEKVEDSAGKQQSPGDTPS